MSPPGTLPLCPGFGHPMPRYDEFTCEGGHVHRTYTCGARIGRRTCDGAATVPEVTPECEGDDEDDDESEGP